MTDQGGDDAGLDFAMIRHSSWNSNGLTTCSSKPAARLSAMSSGLP